MAEGRQPGAFLGCAVAAFAAGGATPAGAHAFGERYDLPVPLALYLTGAAAAVVLSFIVIGAFLRDADWSRDYPRLNLLRRPAGRLLANPGVLNAVRLTGVLLLALVIIAGLAGNQNPMRNIAPTLVWVVWWVGLALISAFIGDLWTLLNPWRTLFAWAEAVHGRLSGGRALARGLPYPAGLGEWPAFALLFAFAWIELVSPAPAVPANVAWMAIAYSAVTFGGMWLFGRETWLRHGEAFALLFGTLARFAPLEIRVTGSAPCEACGLGCRDRDGRCVNCAACFARAGAGDREWALRPFAVGLLRDTPVSGSMVAFVLLMMAALLFDGVMATPAWQVLEDRIVGSSATAADVARIGLRTTGLTGAWLSLLGAYAAAAVVMSAAVGHRPSAGAIARRFVFTLVPIAIGYHLAHYLTFLLIQGQYAIPLASDPLGRGWDLLGTADHRIDIAVVGARFAWYLAVGAIVAGHVLAVFLAHVQAMVAFPSRRTALASQVPLTVLMVAFTVLSLSILAEPIVGRAPGDAGTALAPVRGAVDVPDDALLPEAGTGRLRPVGPGRTAKIVIRYGAMTSPFHDGTRTGTADILYAFAFAYRWGATPGPHYDPGVERATALIRERLAGLKLAGVDRASKSFRAADMTFVREMQLVDVYLTAGPRTDEAAAVAPPWSAVPWHVIALMEEAVARGWAAFSEAEAERRGVPWLDIVRDTELKQRLAALLDAFARDGFVPAPLDGMVSPGEARTRWQALQAFHRAHGHFLVTNGPYALKSWSPVATVLDVFRDPTYPLGVGSYDAYALPRRAYVADLAADAQGLTVTAEIETVERFARSHRIARERVTARSLRPGQTLECRFLVIDAAGRVRREGLGAAEADGRFRIRLAGAGLDPARYTVLVTLILDGNRMHPDIRSVGFEVGG